MPVGELHQPHRFPIALRIGHAEVPVRPLLDVSPFLVSDQCDRAAVEPADADHEGSVIRAAPISVELDPVLEEPLHIVERVRPILVTRELDGAPDLLVGRRRLDTLELPLQLLELSRKACPAEQVQVALLRLFSRRRNS